MTTLFRTAATALALSLTAASITLAADPNGSTPTPPRPRDPGPAVQPMPSPQPGPTDLGIHRDLPPPQPPTDLTADRDAELDRIIDVLLGADDLQSPAGWCDGMIDCCNTAWVQGCDFVQFDVDCVAAGGTVQIHTLSDGSTQYECHAT